MKNYNLSEHTADIRLNVEADSLEELFTGALEGLTNFIKKDTFKVSQNFNLEENISLSSIDITSLIIDFLNEILTLMQINKAIYPKVKFNLLNENNLKVKIYGYHIEKFDEDIKAVTYHEAQVIKNKNGNFETTIIFDI